jgi:hypothetical protein
VYNLGTVIDRIIGGYLGYVSIMQLIELLLWSHQTCDSYHKNLSIAGMFLNTTQPIVLGLLVLLFSPKKSPWIYALIVTYSIGVAYYATEYTSDLQCTTPKEKDPHLVWNWSILPSSNSWLILYILTSMGIAILGIPNLLQGIKVALFMAVTMLVSTIVYPRQDMAAMWCFFTAFVPMGYYLSRAWH